MPREGTVAPLRIATSGDYPPFSLLQSAGPAGPARYQGFDIALVEHICSCLRRTPEYVPFAWTHLTQFLAAGDFDLLASGLTCTAQRQTWGSFSLPYAFNQALVLVREDGHVPADFRDLRLGVNQGGYLETLSRRLFPNSQITTTTQNLNLAKLIGEDQADAIVTDSLEGAILQQKWGLKSIAILDEHEIALFFPPTKTALRDAVNTILADLQGGGAIREMARANGLDERVVVAR